MVKIASTMEAAANFFLLLLSLVVSSRVTGTAFSSFLLFDEDGVAARQAQKVLR